MYLPDNGLLYLALIRPIFCIGAIAKPNLNKSCNKNIENKSVQINSIVNKRAMTVLQANRMMLTCTLRNILQKLKDSGLTTSIDMIMNSKPFFIIYPNENEISLSFCKLCLIVRLLMEPLMSKAKADGDVVYYSATQLFLLLCPCEKEVNGYYSWKCLSQKPTTNFCEMPKFRGKSKGVPI